MDPSKNELRYMIARRPMRRILLALCMIASTGACVNLGKPEKVAECANTPKGCINSPVDSALDNRADTASSSIDGSRADGAKPILDGAKTPGDTTPIVPVPDDAGNLPDVLISDTPAPTIEDGPQPDVPPVGPPRGP